MIEAQQPDVAVLQEISRGWLIAGGLDLAEWLSRRLQMPYVYAPGHDYQLGNIIFTRRPVEDWSFTRLPLRNVPLGRGLIRAEIDLGNGKSIDVINTHLSAYATSDDRIPQGQKVLEAWNGAPRSLIAGDMNAHLGDSDIALFLQAGLISAQDATNNGDLLTFTRPSHGDKGQGNGQKFYPMVAAHHYLYMLRQMEQIKDGKRRNAHPKMVKVIKSHSEAELQALADYMSRLPAPQRAKPASKAAK